MQTLMAPLRYLWELVTGFLGFLAILALIALGFVIAMLIAFGVYLAFVGEPLAGAALIVGGSIAGAIWRSTCRALADVLQH